MQTAIDRLNEFVKWTKLKGYIRSDREFEAFCGLSNGYMNNMSSAKKGSIGSDKIGLIADKFPQLNVRWLCTGKGCMITDEDVSNEKVAASLITLKKLESIIKSMVEQ